MIQTSNNTDSSTEEEEIENYEKEKNKKREKKLNFLLLGFGFFCYSCSYYATKSLMTKIHKQLGFYSLGIFFMVYSFSNIFTPFLVKKFKSKNCMIIGLLFSTFWIISNIKFNTYVFLVSSFFIGVGTGLAWTANGTYIIRSSNLNNVGSHSGFFFLFYLTGNLGGSVSCSIFLNVLEMKDQTLFMVYSSLAIFGIVILLFLKKSEKTHHKETVNEPEAFQKHSILISIKRNTFAMFGIFKSIEAILAIPMMMITGLCVLLVFGIISPKLEKNKIPNLLIIYGVMVSLSSFSIGKLVDSFGLKVTLIGCTLIEILAVVLCFFAKSGSSIVLFILIYALFGLSGSGLDTATYPLQMYLFPNRVEDATAAFKFPRTLSTGIGFLVGNHFNGYITFSIVLFLQLLTIVCFLILDRIVPLKKPHSYIPIKEQNLSKSSNY
ncbi:et translation product-related [Anaeramoeba flamelloides]|uniref:Et translation product-related n=1 Tax=Anaeramoeba flamelloides TaxID=1746091 RepID=A0AAV7Z1S9_9EUKA|nr:et translation product-related [Anaeramoeba flamelloides]